MQKGFGLIGILIVVGIITVLGIGILKTDYLSRNPFIPTTEEKSAIKEAEEMKNLLEKKSDDANTSGDIAAETKDWKTYRNDKYGFEFKYPENSRYEEDNEFLVLNFKTADGRDIYLTLGLAGTIQKIPKTIEEIKVQYSEKSSRYVTIGADQWLEGMDGGCEGGECAVNFFYYHDKLLRNNTAIEITIPLTSEESNRDPRQYLGEELRMVKQLLFTFKFTQ